MINMLYKTIQLSMFVLLLLFFIYMCINTTQNTTMNIFLQKTSKSKMFGDHPKSAGRSNQPGNTEFAAWWDEQKKLKKNIKEVCHKYGKQAKVDIRPGCFLYIAKANILNCFTSKAGSSAVKRILYEVATGHPHEGEKLRMDMLERFSLKKKFNKKRLNSSTVSFTLVRHPFERLVSAFQHKMIDQKSPIEMKPFKEYFQEITFPNFVKHILLDQRKRCRTMSTCSFNRHWLPYITSCSLCNFDYTAVGRLETMQQDLLFIGQMAGTELQKNVSTNPSSGGSTSQLATEYFSQVDRGDVIKLYQLYKIDFDMLGYSADDYINMAKNI